MSVGHNANIVNKEVTPNLSRLAEDGLHFTRAYCNAPLTPASRYSLLTGRLPHSVGATRAYSFLSEEQITIAHVLSLAERGPYATCASGSLIFENAERQRNSGLPLHGFAEWRIPQDLYKAFIEDLTRAEPRRIPEDVRIQAAPRPFRDPPRVWLNAANFPVGAYADALPSTIFAQKGVDFMERRKARPFFLFVVLTQPRAPFEYPIEYRDKFEAAKMQVPTTEPQDEKEMPLVFRGMSQAEKQGVMAAYLTAAAYLDHCVGIVLDGLAGLGLERDTLVIYTSETGYCLGEHGRFEAGCLNEPAVRVPLILRWPARVRPGQSSDALVELVDLFPTIAEACQTALSPGIEGRSLVGLLDGKAGRGRDFVFSELLESEEAMIRTDRYKMIYTTGKRRREDGYTTGEPLAGRRVRLYDLEADPGERRDVAGDPRHAGEIERMKRMMLERFLMASPEGTGLPPSATLEDQLDVLLVPRESWRDVWALLRS